MKELGLLGESGRKSQARTRRHAGTMRRFTHALWFMLLAGISVVLAQEHRALTQTWDFDAIAAGTLPPAFTIGTLYDGRPAGEWKVIEAAGAPSGKHVLAQLMNKGAEHAYKVVLIEGTKSSDIELEVSFLAVGGKGDMGGGLIWRATDDRNYYLTRANPLEQNVRVYHVVKGVRRMIANADRQIDVRKWHRLRVVATGCDVAVFFDDEPVATLCDETFKNGRVGLWTKSDAVSYFDNLRLSAKP